MGAQYPRDPRDELVSRFLHSVILAPELCDKTRPNDDLSLQLRSRLQNNEAAVDLERGHVVAVVALRDLTVRIDHHV